MKYNLYLDDFRSPADSFPYTKDRDYVDKLWLTVRDYDQFVRIIEKHHRILGVLPELISFDHDLAEEHYYPLETSRMHEEALEEGTVDKFYLNAFKERTGYCCAKWLVNFCMDHNLKLPAFKVHSQNPAGAENIRSLLKNFQKFQYTESNPFFNEKKP